MIVYLDSVFLLNSLLDGLLLYFTGYLTGALRKLPRLLAAAFLGGGYAAVSFLPAGAWTSFPGVQVMIGLVMVWIAFGGKQRFLKTSLLFTGLSCTLAGGVIVCSLYVGVRMYHRGAYLLPVPPGLLFLGAVGCFGAIIFFCRGQFQHRVRGELAEVSFQAGEEKVSFLALCDNGNTLKDPLDGAPVLVADGTAAAQRWRALGALLENRPALSRPEALLQALTPEERAQFPFRLLGYRSVGTASGLLLGCTIHNVQIGGRQLEHLTLALSPTPVSEQGEYMALWGGETRA